MPVRHRTRFVSLGDGSVALDLTGYYGTLECKFATAWGESRFAASVVLPIKVVERSPAK